MLTSKLSWLIGSLPEPVRARAQALLATADGFLEHVLLPAWAHDSERPWWERLVAMLPVLTPIFESLVQQATRDPDLLFKLFARIEQLMSTISEHPEILDAASDLFAQALERSSGQAVTLFDWLTQPRTTERALELLTLFEKLVLRWIEEATAE